MFVCASACERGRREGERERDREADRERERQTERDRQRQRPEWSSLLAAGVEKDFERVRPRDEPKHVQPRTFRE